SAAGTGDLSIINGNVGTGGTFSACAMTGVCLPGGGTASVTQGATGNINLGTVTINIGGGLTISAGSTTGTASIGTISAGGNIGINAGGNITLNGAITGGGNVAITGTQLFLSSSMVLDAGTNLSLNADLGAVATPHAFDVTLSANNNVNINNNIFLASNNLTLAADGDGNGFGNVEINGSTTESRTVLTQGLLSVTGENFNINGADFGTTPSVRIGIATALDVQANSINATIGNQLNINAGQVFVGTSGATGTRDVSVAVNATNDVNITATGLSVQGGDIFASQSSYAGFVTARGNATLSAGNNITIAVSGNLSVKGGSADGRASFYSSGSAKAFANASISAGNNVNVTNVGGVMTVAAGPATALMTRVVEGTGSAVGQANAKIDANNITVTSAGSLNISRGGATAQIDGFSSGSYSATASANASLIATQAINLNVIGDINLNGTVSNIASASVNSNDTGNYTVVANSNILVKGGTDVTITTTNGGLSIAGGSAS
ncbi:MAG: hypothetical protein GY779_17585, partial [Gammaproteobacteria bacterium]|nr:hypothetical protein [Gammaproteobacteria bacterium]